MNGHVKIIIAEPSVIIRTGIISILKKLNSLRADLLEASDPEQLRKCLCRNSPDILIISPSFTSFYPLKQIKKDCGCDGIKCVALQSSLSDVSSFTIFDDVISIYDSAEKINDKLIKLIQSPEPDKRRESLSAREKEIIVCVVKGMTNKEIAEELCLSAHTVITHRRNISSKLQIHSTAGLTIYAIVNNLVGLSEIGNVVNVENQ